MHAAPHNYRVAGKLYDRAHTWRVLIFSLSLSLSPPSGYEQSGPRWKITRRNGPRPRQRSAEKANDIPPGEKETDLRSRVAQRHECRDSAARSPILSPRRTSPPVPSAPFCRPHDSFVSRRRLPTAFLPSFSDCPFAYVVDCRITILIIDGWRPQI